MTIMQAVILAAGRGTRMGSLTEDVPKPMLIVAGKTLLEHKLEMLPSQVDEVIFVIGYHGNVIEQKFGDQFAGRKIRYVVQEKLDGTMGALACAKEILHDRFVVLMGDDLYCREDIEKMISLPGWSLAVWETAAMASGGKILIENGKITDIQEGEHAGTAGYMCTNLFLLDTRIFEHPMIPKSEGSEEYGLPQTVLTASRAGNISFSAVTASAWFQVTAPEDLPKAQEWLDARD